MEVGSDNNVDELKIKIRSVLLSSQQGVKKSSFLGEYTQLTGEGINVKRLGFKTIGDFMASIPDTVTGRGDSYTAVTTETTEHLEKLIHRQRPPTTYNRSRDTGHPRNNYGPRQPVRKYGRNGASSHHQHHKAAPGRRFNRHVSSSSSSGPPTHRNGHSSSYNANNKFKPPSQKISMAVPRLPVRATPVVNTNSTTTPVNGLRTKVLSILCQAADGLHITGLQKRFRSQTGTNIPFAEYGYSSIGDLMLGFMWNNFKCIHSGDFYFAVRSSSSRPSNNSSGSMHNNNNNNNDNNHHYHRQSARNGNNGPTWGRNGNNTTGPFNNNNRHRPMSFRDSSDNKRNTMSRPSETNGSMQQSRRFIHQHSNNPRGPPNRYIHRNKEQTANNRGQRAVLSIGDDNNKETFINNQLHNFNGSSYGETDSLTTTTSSSHYHHHHHHQGTFHHRLSRSDTTRSEFPSDASSSSDYSPTTASGSFRKNLKSEANNNTRNRSYSTTSNNSVGGGSNSSQPLEDCDYDYDDSLCDENLSFHSGEESQIFKNTFDPISSGLRFKKGRGCGRGYGLSSYMGERLPGEPRPSERSVALSENWNSTEKLSFQHGNTPVENLIISIRNTSLSDNDDIICDGKQPTSALDVGCGLGRGRGRTRKTSDPSTRF